MTNKVLFFSLECGEKLYYLKIYSIKIYCPRSIALCRHGQLMFSKHSP